jgi:predicted transcriptional regulator
MTAPRPSSLATPPRAAQAEMLLRVSSAFPGPVTPITIRRQAAGILRAGGCTYSQIAGVFGVSQRTIRQDLQRWPPWPSPANPPSALAQLAQDASPRRHQAAHRNRTRRRTTAARPPALRLTAMQQLLSRAGQLFGPGTPPATRCEVTAILRAAGCTYRQIADVFGISPGAAQQDAARRIRKAPGAQSATLAEFARLAAELTPYTAADRQQLLDLSGQLFGPGTPPATRRDVTAILVAAGCTHRQIAALFGISGSTTSQDASRAGIPPAAATPAAALVALAALDTPSARAQRRDRLGWMTKTQLVAAARRMLANVPVAELQTWSHQQLITGILTGQHPEPI